MPQPDSLASLSMTQERGFLGFNNQLRQSVMFSSEVNIGKKGLNKGSSAPQGDRRPMARDF